MSTHTFEGRTAIVTGVASGIGAAIADALVGQGTVVHGVDLRPVEDRPDDGFVFHRGDVSVPKTAAEVVATVVSERSSVDALVNCAGIAPTGTIEETTPETWDRLFRVNVDSVYLFTRAAVPHMSSGAAIVNIASETGLVGTPGATAYAATKAAVISITKSVALELADRGVRANCVCPGTIDTPLTQSYFDSLPDPAAARAASDATHPLGTGTVQDVAAATLFLLSDSASYITGHALAVDGGFTSQ